MKSREERRNDILKKIEEAGEKDFPIKKKELSADDPIVRLVARMKRKMKRYE